MRPSLPPHRPRPTAAPLALAGLRVVDFSRMLAGPFATQQLADLGAEVIKIEAPVSGDDSRHYTTTALNGECAFFLSTNRNKKSIELNLKTEAGAQVARRLVDTADIVVENFSNGVMDRLGLDYNTLSARNPRLIYCSISGYGRDEPADVARRAYDAMIQAGSGFMSLTGESTGLPMRTQVPMIDTATAIMASNAILGAVIARDRLGRGQFIEVSLIDVAMSILTIYGMAFLVSGEDMKRNGNRAPQTAPSDVYHTLDFPIFVTCGNDRMFRTMVTLGLKRPDLADNPDFATNADRVKHTERMTKMLNDIFRSNTRAHWLGALSEIGIPAAAVLTVGEAMTSDDVSRRNILSEIPHPTAGAVPNVRSPFVMSLTPTADPVAPPLLGQHAREILVQILGLDDAQIHQLAANRAFGPTEPR